MSKKSVDPTKEFKKNLMNSSSVLDPHHFGKLDPDPNQSGKLDPDPPRSGKLDRIRIKRKSMILILIIVKRWRP
jgi:hypothetical protein